MSGYDTQRPVAVKIDLRDHGAAWLQPWQCELVHVADHALLEQAGHFRASHGSCHWLKSARAQAGLKLEPRQVKKPVAIAEAIVGFLAAR